MKKQSTVKKRKRKTNRKFTAEEKVTAVLSLWSERRTTADLGREMDLSYTMLQNWQNQALEAMLKTFEPRVSEDEKRPKLHPKLAKLLAKKKEKKSPALLQSKLKDRLEELQKK